MTERASQLRRRLRWWTTVLILGLVFSGITALPLPAELHLLARWLGAENFSPEQARFTQWVLLVRDGLNDTNAKYPFMAYATDWLAFAHIVLALAFVGALRHPVRNAWLFTFGMVASACIVPWALIMGGVRAIPVGWRLIDCAFGIAGFIPCWLNHRWAHELERLHVHAARPGFKT